jgi:Carboxypeptidase regulatory-like domain
MKLLSFPVAMILLCGVALAQTSGMIGGAIKDASGGLMVNAKVSALNATTGEKREAVSNSTGQYTFPFLPPGEYQIQVSGAGFATASARAVLGVTERIAVDIVLQPAGVAEKIEITSTAPLLQTESAALGRVVDGAAVKELPLSTRNFTQLLALSPGNFRPLE